LNKTQLNGVVFNIIPTNPFGLKQTGYETEQPWGCAFDIFSILLSVRQFKPKSEPAVNLTDTALHAA
jgi:hypothetical protein